MTKRRLLKGAEGGKNTVSVSGLFMSDALFGKMRNTYF